MLEDAAGLAALRALGARSVPVVARGGRFVYAQVISEVIAFLGLAEAGGPQLPPAELAARADLVLATAARLVRQLPDDSLANMLPGRPRSWRVLAHHVFQIPVAFLEMEEKGVRLEYEVMTAPPPDELATSTQIAGFGESVRQRFARWWAGAAGGDFGRSVDTYFGGTSRHEMLERTVWHSAQHVRQLAALVESLGLAPDRPLGPAEIRGLPLTDRIWDEA